MYTRGGGSQNVVLLLYDRPFPLRRVTYSVYIWKLNIGKKIFKIAIRKEIA